MKATALGLARKSVPLTSQNGDTHAALPFIQLCTHPHRDSVPMRGTHLTLVPSSIPQEKRKENYSIGLSNTKSNDSSLWFCRSQCSSFLVKSLQAQEYLSSSVLPMYQCTLCHGERQGRAGAPAIISVTYVSSPLRTSFSCGTSMIQAFFSF